jgi:hypothetical protein
MPSRVGLIARTVVKDVAVSSPKEPSTTVEAISAFFVEHGAASLCLPSGWFGRPYDNYHRLTGVASDGDDVVVRLDERQLLRIRPEGTSWSRESDVLTVVISGGRWNWTSYGGDQEHAETLGPGHVELHAPFHPEAPHQERFDRER